jgi:hypothetical protein
MTRDRRIRFNGFKCSTVAHTTAGLWRHPNSQSHRYKELSFWIELAKTLERGKFDSLFVADALGVLDFYRGSPDQTLREGLQTPTDDPLLAVSAMAAVTQHLGFGITVASLYELPYLFARKMTTLDHLTDGRIENALIEGEGFNQLPRVAFELLAELQQVAAGGKSSTLRGNDNCAQCPIGRGLVQHAV